MTRAYYVVRIGNVGFARTSSASAPNHWHYLSPQRLWGFPKGMTVVKVRARFMADINDASTTVYVWFLCNGHGGRVGRFVAVGIGTGLSPGPDPNPTSTSAAEGRTIPNNVMQRLREGFDHWFTWQPVRFDEASLQERLSRIPAPKPTYIPTLRRVTAEHESFQAFEALIEAQQRLYPLPPPSLAPPGATGADNKASIMLDLENLQREQDEPRSKGYVYLISMADTAFYKIGMSLDPRIRLQTLQTGNPRALIIVRTTAVGDMRGAESRLHRRFEAQRVLDVDSREWFELESEELVREVEGAFQEVGSGDG
ncbi:MAG: hypothetical protein Q9195_006049 [Heterodermia aff. obscurata]